ncbi:MAG TPA: hypothetical protein VED01_02795 [Burkholderiales bacterium]|nr:hypothetical protein [Burkholderiales bacterium]
MSLEKRNVPTATFLTDAFASYGKGLAKMQGMPELPTVIIPHPIAGRPADELREKVRAVYDQVKAAITRGS